jgi:nucleoid-associated protein YgaU
VEAPSRPLARRTLTPAVLLATAFVVGCAVVSIGFVASNGGLQVPQLVGAGAGGSGGASPTPESSPALAIVEPTPGSQPSPVPTGVTPTAAPPGPSAAPTPVPSTDPLTALPGCPDQPGCYLYTIRRGDTLSTIGDHWLISVSTLEVLNPQVTDPSTIVIGQILYLGRTPFVRLERCPDMPACYLYVVRAGDRLSTIAGRFGTTTSAILALNPKVTDPNTIYTGETIRLPGPA